MTKNQTATHLPFTVNSITKPALSLCACAIILAGCSTSTEQSNTESEPKESVEVIMLETRKTDAEKVDRDSAAPLPEVGGMSLNNIQIAGAHKRSAIQGLSLASMHRADLYPGYPQLHEPNTEKYAYLEENDVIQVTEHPVSTFSIDVDTASYSNVRRMLNSGMAPPSDAVRTEEFINYFDYPYPLPQGKAPFSLHTDIAVSPWDENRHLMRVAIKGGETPKSQIPAANLVFLIDVSGSMNSPKKLPLLKTSLKMLTKQLSKKDSVAIVVYAGASGVVLEPTAGNDTLAIEQALDALSAGGSTNGASGIELAYSMAQKAFISGGINRVILATDGDFNVGLTDHNQLIDLIKRKREQNVSLSVLGFGQGNYNDHLTEQLADTGNGNAAYIDNINEARKVLVDEVHSTLHTIAKDVKIQIEFNAETVAEYRLIGYENRHLNREDFNNDKVDAGEIGAGHTVTAFYELVLTDSSSRLVDDLRYTQQHPQKSSENSNEIGFLKVRYKEPSEAVSELLSQPILKQDITTYAMADESFKFATSVVGFASLLKQSDYRQGITKDWLIDNAMQNKGLDTYGYRAEFTQLMRNYFAMNQSISQMQSSEDVHSYAKAAVVEAQTLQFNPE